MTTTTSTDYDVEIAQLDLPTRVRLLTGASMFTLSPERSIGLSEVRSRPVPARAEHVIVPETGQQGVEFNLFGADGSLLDKRLSSSATTVVASTMAFAGPSRVFACEREST